MFKKIITFFVWLSPLLVVAQSFYAIRHPRNLTVFGGTGTALYKGELVNPNSLGKVRYNIVAGSEYLFSRRFSVKAELTWFNIAGSDKNANDDRVERNLSFTSNNQELSVQGVVHILKEPKEFHNRYAVNGYVFAGIGVFHMNPKAEYEGKKYPLQPLQTEGASYSRFQFSIPYGIGIKLMVDPLHNIIIEGGYRTTFTDYMDDISSKRYVDPSTLKGGVGGLSAKLADRRKELDPDYPARPNVGVRGNPKQNDGYFLFNIKFQYYLPLELNGTSGTRNAYKKKRKKVFNPDR